MGAFVIIFLSFFVAGNIGDTPFNKQQEKKTSQITSDKPIVEKTVIETITPESKKIEPIKEEIKLKPVKEETKLEPVKEKIKPEPAKEEVKLKPVEEEIKREPIKEEIKPEPIKEEIKPEPVKEEVKELVNLENEETNWIKLILYVLGSILFVVMIRYFYTRQKNNSPSSNNVSDYMRREFKEEVQSDTTEQPAQEEVQSDTTEQQSVEDDEDTKK